MNIFESTSTVASPVYPIAIYLIVAALVLLETSFAYGFILPGNTLLLSAGILAGSFMDINLETVIILAASFSFLGSQIGYLVGKKNPDYLLKIGNSGNVRGFAKLANKLSHQSEWLTIFSSNFIAGLRTFDPIVQGSKGTKQRIYISANALGAIIWAIVVSFIGLKIGEIQWVLDSPFVVIAGLYTIATTASLVNFFRTL